MENDIHLETWTTGDIEVHYSRSLPIGGKDFGQEFLSVIPDKIGEVDKIMEFGCGQGFIGFSLLANNLCNELILVDINEKSINNCRKTVDRNDLSAEVEVYQSDVFSGVSETVSVDLILSNPPHFDGTTEEYAAARNYYDPDWNIHERFYSEADSFLNEGGEILFQENEQGSSASTFTPMIEKNPAIEYVGQFKNKKYDLATTVEMTGSTLLSLIPIRYTNKFSKDIRVKYPYYFVHSRKSI